MVEKFEQSVSPHLLLPYSLREPLYQANRLLDECLGMGEAAEDRDSDALYVRLIGAFDAHDRLEECLNRNDDELKAPTAELGNFDEEIWFSSKHRFVWKKSFLLLWRVAAAAKAESTHVAPRMTEKRAAAHLELLQKVILEHQTWTMSEVSSWRADLELEAHRAYDRRSGTGRTYLVDLEEESLENLEASEFTVDEALFEVRWNDRAPCKLGNTKQFHFLKVLAETPNKYVACAEIAEGIGGKDTDDLAPIKCRLVQRLQEAGYGPIADCIQSQPGYYGLILSGAIKMKS